MTKLENAEGIAGGIIRFVAKLGAKKDAPFTKEQIEQALDKIDKVIDAMEASGAQGPTHHFISDYVTRDSTTSHGNRQMSLF